MDPLLLGSATVAAIVVSIGPAYRCCDHPSPCPEGVSAGVGIMTETIALLAAGATAKLTTQSEVTAAPGQNRCIADGWCVIMGRMTEACKPWLAPVKQSSD